MLVVLHIRGPPPYRWRRVVRLEQVKEATVGCFLERSGMRSRVSEGDTGTGWNDVCVSVRVSHGAYFNYHTTLSSCPYCTTPHKRFLLHNPVLTHHAVKPRCTDSFTGPLETHARLLNYKKCVQYSSQRDAQVRRDLPPISTSQCSDTLRSITLHPCDCF